MLCSAVDWLEETDGGGSCGREASARLFVRAFIPCLLPNNASKGLVDLSLDECIYRTSLLPVSTSTAYFVLVVLIHIVQDIVLCGLVHGRQFDRLTIGRDVICTTAKYTRKCPSLVDTGTVSKRMSPGP